MNLEGENIEWLILISFTGLKLMPLFSSVTMAPHLQILDFDIHPLGYNKFLRQVLKNLTLANILICLTFGGANILILTKISFVSYI
jgi:hypothetical protein